MRPAADQPKRPSPGQKPLTGKTSGDPINDETLVREHRAELETKPGGTDLAPGDADFLVEDDGDAAFGGVGEASQGHARVILVERT